MYCQGNLTKMLERGAGEPVLVILTGILCKQGKANS